MSVLDNQIADAQKKLRWLKAAVPVAYPGDAVSTWYKVFDDAGKDVTYLWKNYAVFYVDTTGKVTPQSYWISQTNLDKLIANKEAQLKNLLDKRATEFAAAAAQAALDAAPKPFNKKGGLIYNVASLKQAYLRPGKAPNPNSIPNFNTFTSADGNTPAVVQEAIELWKARSNHKGMISSWQPPAGGVKVDPEKVSGMGTIGVKDPNRYAFQFLYNPQPVEMQYRGAPPIDVSQYTSGSEEYALWAGGGAGGTISFDLLLMRMYDMPFYKNVGGKGVCTNTEIYKPGRAPAGENNKGTLFNEQDAIYNKGTMYDIEFLLRTVLGIKINSQLRGETSDVGWIGAMPVELHLGPGLRYWGTLSGLSINHVIFNERMVPVFSTVHVEFSRLPDYVWQPTQGSKLGTTSGGGLILQGNNGNQRIQQNGRGGQTLRG